MQRSVTRECGASRSLPYEPQEEVGSVTSSLMLDRKSIEPFPKHSCRKVPVPNKTLGTLGGPGEVLGALVPCQRADEQRFIGYHAPHRTREHLKQTLVGSTWAKGTTN